MIDKAVPIGASFAILAVAFGAFGAHAFKALLLANGHLTTYNTASQYHFIHALGLMLISCLPEHLYQVVWLNRAAWMMVLGTVIFCGSLYMLAISGLTWWGAITPIGGLLLLLAWVFVVISTR